MKTLTKMFLLACWSFCFMSVALSDNSVTPEEHKEQQQQNGKMKSTRDALESAPVKLGSDAKVEAKGSSEVLNELELQKIHNEIQSDKKARSMKLELNKLELQRIHNEIQCDKKALSMKKKEINKLLKDKKFKKLVNEIKRHAKDINKQQKQFDKTFEKIVKTQKKFEKQLAQLKK